MKIKLSDIKLIPLSDTVYRDDIPDEVYFGKKYREYISNSRLKLINPSQFGSPKTYLRGFDGRTTQSLTIGSGVHQLLLQSSDFELAPNLNKPSAKLGNTIDSIIKYRKAGWSIDKSIRQSCIDCDYYVNQIDRQIPNIIKKGFEYYWKHKQYEDSKYIHLCERDKNVVEKCLESCKQNRNLTSKLNPTDIFGDPQGKSFNEDAFFIDFVCVYKDKACVLKIKLKADNWTIDIENRKLVLNDLKTTGHFVDTFMDEGCSFEKFHYGRQLALYSAILIEYAKQKYGFDKKTWAFECNILAVQTIPPYNNQVFRINNSLLKKGKQEYEELLKRVGCHTIFGFDKSIDFV